MQSLRERKKVKTRQALVQAAIQLFVDQGYSHTTVDQITELADVSRRTFFRYFPSKEAVVFPDRAQRLDLLRQLLGNNCSLRKAFLGLAHDFVNQRQIVIAQQQIIDSSTDLVAYQRELDSQFEDAVAEALISRGDGSEKNLLESQIVAAAVIAAVRVTLQRWFATNGKADLVEMGNEMFDLLERGFGDQQ